MIAFIDDHRDVHGVEPICKVLPIAPSTYHAHVARRTDPDKQPARARSDAALMVEIRRVFAVVISQHPGRTTPRAIDAEMDKWRHLIENFFCKLKEFKRIALCADKTDQSFAAMIHLAAAVIASR